MDRTLRAALVAAVIGFATVAGLGVLLGFPAVPSVVAGLVTAALFGGLLLAADRRAGSMTPDDPGTGPGQ